MINEFLDTRAVVDGMESLQLGTPMTHDALSLVPLYQHDRERTLVYQTLGAAIASGQAFVVEAPDASVPTLRILNSGQLAVLVLDGEEVVGGLQNRLVNTTLLVPGGAMFELPVSCVEQGRWHEATSVFGMGEVAFPSLRRRKIEQVSASLAQRGAAVADQGVVWQEVAERHQRDGTSSATGSMHDSYEQRRGELQAAEASFIFPLDGPVGVLTLIEGRSHCADIFDCSDTCREYWPRLVRSYSLEALGTRQKAPSMSSAQRLLQRTRAARHVAHKSSGLGFDVRLSGNGIVGAALVFQNTLVHAAIFRQK